MNAEQDRGGKRLLLRIGAVAAIVGTVLQVAAGSSQSALLGGTADVALESLAAQPQWLWPLVYLGFIVGALFWVGALVALETTLSDGGAWALGRLAVASVILGVSLHAVDGVLNVGGLASLARAWPGASVEERTLLAQDGELLLRVLDGTWAGVIMLFHGTPFVLAGLAVAVSRRYPAWLGWAGFVGGAGSAVVGVLMFFGVASAGPAVPFAVILSLFMVALGWLMWGQASNKTESPSPAD